MAGALLANGATLYRTEVGLRTIHNISDGVAAVVARVIAYWYVTGVLAGLGFSSGLYLLRPDTRAVRGTQDVLDALLFQDGHWSKPGTRMRLRIWPIMRCWPRPSFQRAVFFIWRTANPLVCC